jgi:predicted amino acid-binding ACT domain protein
MTSYDYLLRLALDLAYSRMLFFREHRTAHETRSFLTNEATILRLAQNISPNVLATLLLTSTFEEPVTVALTNQQIERATEVIHVPETSQEICCICQDSLRASPSYLIRQCRHTLHQTCATQWFSMSVRCPLCRVDLRETQPEMNNEHRR